MLTRKEIIRYAEQHLTGSLAFTDDGNRIAYGVGAGDIVIRDLRASTRLVMHAFDARVSSLAFSHDGAMLASADISNHPLVWDASTGRRISELRADHVYAVAFSGTGRTLAASADDMGVYLWDLSGAEPKALPSLPLHGEFGWAMSTPVGDTIAVGDENGAVSLWNLRRGERLHTFQDRGRSETVTIALSPDGVMLASAGFNGSIVLRDLASTPLTGFHAQVKDLKVSPDGSIIAAATSDGGVRLWDKHGKLTGILAGHPDQVEAVAFSPDGRLLAAVTRNVTVTIWDVQRQQRLTGPLPGSGLGATTDVVFEPSGTRLATSTLGINVWDLPDAAKPVNITSRFDSRITNALAFTRDGRQLLGASVSGHINVWDSSTGKLTTRVKTLQSAVQDIALSPDGSMFATAGDDRTVKLWNTATLTEIALLRGHSAPIQVLAFSSDGRTLASAGDDHTVIVWDIPNRTLTASLTGHTARIRGLAFIDGKLISGGEDGRIIRWSLDPVSATAAICTSAGRTLTQAEWDAYLPSIPYEPSRCPNLAA